jgi:hypothetical protein
MKKGRHCSQTFLREPCLQQPYLKRKTQLTVWTSAFDTFGLNVPSPE